MVFFQPLYLGSSHHSRQFVLPDQCLHPKAFKNSFLIHFVSLHWGLTQDFVITRNCTTSKIANPSVLFSDTISCSSRLTVKWPHSNNLLTSSDHQSMERLHFVANLEILPLFTSLLARWDPRKCGSKKSLNTHMLMTCSQKLLTCCVIFSDSSMSCFKQANCYG